MQHVDTDHARMARVTYAEKRELNIDGKDIKTCLKGKESCGTCAYLTKQFITAIKTPTVNFNLFVTVPSVEHLSLIYSNLIMTVYHLSL